ncbi:dTDP-4-dehydrorhamnose reductase family protein [Ramlibacter sp.]|uniref:dTDP-4-dehydrorhamnose reductase family protein n=1 Tax=Ramlibacter sp. TaxID=1917967 RepID=UPI003D0B7A31
MILVTGATGLLGTTLVPQLRALGRVVSTHAQKSAADHAFDLSDREATFASLDKIRPEVIVNLVGLTSVERCQERTHESYLLNTRTVENIAGWIAKSGTGSHLVQISTDQVYDGTGPHREDRITLTNNYAFSKYAGELAAGSVGSTILRTNFVGRSKAPHRESLTDWVINAMSNQRNVEVLDDVYFSPLSMTTLGEMIDRVIEMRPAGVFNLGARDGMTKADFDFAFAEKMKLPTQYMKRILAADAHFLKAYRPKDMRMDCTKFERTLQVRLPDLQSQIDSLAKEYDDQA